MDKTQELLATLVEIIKSTTDFTKEQAPLLAREMLEYGATTSTLWLIFFSALVVVAVAVYIRAIIVIKQHGYDQEIQTLLSTVMLTFALAFLSIGVFNSADNLIKIKTAPRLYILEQIQRKVR